MVKRPVFLESKPHLRCISLPKHNYETNDSYLPLLDYALFDGVRAIPDACAFADDFRDRRGLRQRRCQRRARRERNARG